MRAPDDALQGLDASPVGFLLLAPGDGTQREGYPYGLSRPQALRASRSHTLLQNATASGSSWLWKPHPRSSHEWVVKATETIRAAVPGTRVEAIMSYAAVPIEIALSNVEVVAAAGLGSSSLRTLATLYEVSAYSSDHAMRDLHEADPRHAELTETWISDNRDHYTAI